MMYHLLIAGVGVVGLLALWLGVQSLARRHGHGHGAGDCEGPEHMACNACAPDRAGTCGMRSINSDTE